MSRPSTSTGNPVTQALARSWPFVCARSETQKGNIGGGADDLIVLTIPGATLIANGDRLLIRCAGRYANNGNAKRLRGYWNGTLIFDDGGVTLSNVPWVMEIEVMRLDATTALVVTQYNGTAQSAGSVSTAFASAVDQKLTSESTADDDIIQYSAMATCLPKDS